MPGGDGERRAEDQRQEGGQAGDGEAGGDCAGPAGIGSLEEPVQRFQTEHGPYQKVLFEELRPGRYRAVPAGT